MKQLSTEKRARVVALLEEGNTVRYVAHVEGIHFSTVSRINKRLKETGSNENKLKSGRPRLITSRDERKVLRLITSNEAPTAIQAKEQLERDENIEVSTETIRRTLRRNGLVARTKIKKPYLKKTHRNRRFTFAKRHLHWTISDWSKVIWSDESKFNIFSSDGKEYCWKKVGEPLRDSHVKPTVKFGGGNIMVWGCFTSLGVGNLCKIDGKMDSELYRRILTEDFLGTLSWYNLNKEEVIFQQDNDPKHTAKLTKEWFEENDIKVLEWPAQSPDLNPIEHLWNEVDRRLRKLPVKVTKKDKLWEQIQDVWNDINLEVCTKLIESMPQRIQDVMKARGGYTRW